MIQRFVLGLLGLAWLSTAAAQTCGTAAPVQLQVLGSGSAELHDRRAASGYLVWIEGKARVLVDIGGGAALRFAESGATVADLDVILLTRLHAGHSADLPALVGTSLSEKRARPLTLLGPGGNRLMPSTVTFVRTLFDGTRGAYRHLGDLLNPLTRNGYKLQPRDVRPSPDKLKPGPKPDGETVYPFTNERLRAGAVPMIQGNIPTLVWRVDAGGKSLVFGGDAEARGEPLARLARGADLLVMSHTAPEGAGDTGQLAQRAQVKQLVLSQRTRNTLGKEETILAAMHQHYAGPASFANDLDCLTP